LTSNLHATYQFETAQTIFVIEHVSIVTLMAYLSRMIVLQWYDRHSITIRQ